MPNLLLIPTAFERDRLRPMLQQAAPELLVSHNWQIDLCGFGLVAAAARTSQLLAMSQPDQVVLLGIAGSYGETLPVGSACRFDSVRCAGVGVGSLDKDDYQSAESLGWSQLTYPRAGGLELIGDQLELSWGSGQPQTSQLANQMTNRRELLSVTGAAASPDAALRRAAMFPFAAAEDMEGYAVALACRIHGVPLSIVRGISNVAGDRVHANWQVTEALQSAVQLLMKTIRR